MADAFTYGSTVMSTYGVYVTSSTMPGMADVVVNDQQRGISEGGVNFGGTRKPKRWTDNCYLVASSFNELRTRMDTVCSALNPRGGDQLYVPDFESFVDSGYRRGAYCRLNGPIDVTLVAKWCYQFTLNWLNLRGTDVASTISTLAGQSGTFNVTVGGNAYAYPTYTCTGDNFTLTNNTTGEALQILYASASDSVVIDTWAKTITRVSGTDSYNALGFMVAGGQFPRLQGGVTNSLTISTGTVGLSWRNEWL